MPTCPRCDYDLSGLVATWTSVCPMQATCSECGAISSTRLWFAGHPGPAWSVEHAGRRMVGHWIRTTAMTFRPLHLWRGMRPEHPIHLRRLALMGVLWLLCIHALVAAVVGASRVWVEVQTPGILGGPPYWAWRAWPFWSGALRGLAWPYPSQITIPISSNQMLANPVTNFVILAVVPHIAMAGLVYFWARPLRRRELSVRHLGRAVVLSLPVAGAWLGILALMYAVCGVFQSWNGQDLAAGVVALVTIGGFAISLIWWWRCFVVEYLGQRKWGWVLVVLGLAAMAITLAVGAVSETL